eukprot:2398374-Rhodomonas_salina.3
MSGFMQTSFFFGYMGAPPSPAAPRSRFALTHRTAPCLVLRRVPLCLSGDASFCVACLSLSVGDVGRDHLLHGVPAAGSRGLLLGAHLCEVHLPQHQVRLDGGVDLPQYQVRRTAPSWESPSV